MARVKSRAKKDQLNERRREKTGILGCYKIIKGCMDCGFRGHASMLDFDHRDRFTKKFNLAHSRHMPWPVIWAEVRKCDVVCKGCHMKRTHGK